MIVLELILFSLFLSCSLCRRPDKVYCANEKCDGLISKAKTLLSYNSPDPDLISFRGNAEALIYMKSAGTNADLWYAFIDGKAGLVNSKFLRENKIINGNPQFIVSYEPKAKDVQPDKVQQAHEIIEGTTIYTTEAAVNTGQQDTTSQPTTISANKELTPPLEQAVESPIDNMGNTSQNINNHDSSESSENMQDTKQNSEPYYKEDLDKSIEKSIEVPKPIEDTVNKDMEDPKMTAEIESKLTKKDTDYSGSKESVGVKQVKQDLNQVYVVESALQHLSTFSDIVNNELNSEPVPEKKEFKEIKEANIKEEIVTSNQEKNTLIHQDTSADSNVENPLNELSIEQNHDKPPSVLISNDVSKNNGVQTTNNMVPPMEPLAISEIEEIPTTEVPINTEMTSPLETSSSTPPELETVSTVPPPVTTETIPAFYPQETHTLTTEETIPPIINMEQSTSETQFSEQSDIPPFNIETSTFAPIYSTEQTANQQNEPESTTPQDSYYSLPPSEENTHSSPNDQLTEEIFTTTETPKEDEITGGFFSNMYSSVADIWPSTTEQPPPIYNTEDYPTYENDKSEEPKRSEEEGFSFIKYIMSTYYTVMGTSEESKALFASVGETCYTDEYCDGTSKDGSNRLLTFLLTTATSVLLFTLGYYYIDNRRQDGRLIGQINSLQRDLLFTTKECEILKEQLSSTKNKLAGIEDSSFGMDDMVQSLKEEINELKATNERLRNSLDDNEKLLRVSENTAGELQNTLSELENTLSELLTERANFEEQIVELNGKIQAFEEELISVSRDRDNFQLKYVSAESALEELKKQMKQLEDVTQQLSESKNIMELQRHEINALKDAIKELKSGMPSNVDVTSLIDHTEIIAKLSKALEEKKAFESKYEKEHKERVLLTEELKTTQETLHTTSQNATEALTRLDVLGKYFQERESELMKELNAKESLWLSKQGESTSTVEKMELLQQEIQRYKEKCDALTLELAEQESSRRAALSAVESRAHAAWLEARAARRDADAARDEATALRRKLAAISTIPPVDGAVSPHHKIASPLDNVENSVIPPPLPPMFLPPPLLPPLPRPPPLGRLPSPHPPRYGDRRYSPESRYSPGSRYSPDSRYSPETVRYSPDSRYSPRSRRSAYSPRSRRRSRERYEEGRGSRTRNGPADTETEYNSDSPSREPRRRSRYSRHSGPSSGSGCSSESDK